MEIEAKEALILRLFRSYPGADKAISRATVDAYLHAVADISSGVLAQTVSAFTSGLIEGRNSDFVPSAESLAKHARLRMPSAAEPTLYNGLTSMDWGGGSVDLRGLTTAEQDIVIAAKGITADGRNMALMSLDEIKQEVTQGQIAGPARVMPKLQGMR